MRARLLRRSPLGGDVIISEHPSVAAAVKAWRRASAGGRRPGFHVQAETGDEVALRGHNPRLFVPTSPGLVLPLRRA